MNCIHGTTRPYYKLYFEVLKQEKFMKWIKIAKQLQTFAMYLPINLHKRAVGKWIFLDEFNEFHKWMYSDML